jgi:hypothetical protein
VGAETDGFDGAFDGPLVGAETDEFDCASTGAGVDGRVCCFVGCPFGRLVSRLVGGRVCWSVTILQCSEVEVSSYPNSTLTPRERVQ